MKETIKWIGSGRTPYQIGIYLGIALIIISLLGSTTCPWFQPLFDWMLVLFIGIGIFFFFMGIRLNTEEDTNIETDTNLNKNERNKRTFSSFKIYLTQFNILSKSCFVISGIFGFLIGCRLLTMLLSSL